MINYPAEFESSVDNTKISDKDIENRVNKALEIMKSNNEKEHMSFSGDTMIFIHKMHEEDGGGYEIIVTKDYRKAYVDNKVFN